MEDKELVEVWRAKFQRLHKTNSVYGFEMRHGEYIDGDVEDHWKTFLMAKRSQPSVVLPKPDDIYDSEYTWQGRYYHECIVTNSLTDAGIKYTIKE